eukprot:5193640-Prymnesium_polylepis.1
MISSSSSALRCATVPMDASLQLDQRVANCVQPKPLVRMSICLLRYSSCWTSGLFLIAASTAGR